MLVEVAVARTDTAVDAIAATGEIEAVQSIALRPEVDGRIVGILFQEGQEVAQGTALFKVDDAELKSQVAQAEADRDLSQQALVRTRQLIADKASSQADLERAEATARSDQAKLDLLETRLARTTVRAPFGGVTGQRKVSLGDYVNSSNELVSLQTVNPERAAFQVPERYAERLRRGQKVTFRVAALPGQEFVGVVDFVDPVVQLPGRTITVKALVPNPKRTLQAGMYVDLRLAAEVRPNAILVPEEAIVPIQGANFVYVIQDAKASRRQVGLGHPGAGQRGDPQRPRRRRHGRGRRAGTAAGRHSGDDQADAAGRADAGTGGEVLSPRARRSAARVVVLVTALGFAAGTVAAQAPVSGRWAMRISNGARTLRGDLRLVQSGSSLSGTLVVEPSDAPPVAIREGRIAADGAFSFAVEGAEPMRVTGSRAGATLTGQALLQHGATWSWTAQRLPDGAEFYATLPRFRSRQLILGNNVS